MLKKVPSLINPIEKGTSFFENCIIDGMEPIGTETSCLFARREYDGYQYDDVIPFYPPGRSPKIGDRIIVETRGFASKRLCKKCSGIVRLGRPLKKAKKTSKVKKAKKPLSGPALRRG